MKKFWNWIKNSDDTRILRLEGPIDEESFWCKVSYSVATGNLFEM